ncbi:MAG: nucleoside phosphorylase [Bacteroidales bacterium]|nr:nucleoside phosphorylase [Bacteroidales bacterium]
MMKASELVLAPDGSLYHIRLTSSTLADKVLLVGDPGRVEMFKGIFDQVEFESSNREIHALTGSYHGTRLTALSTGMGCDNIDIVMTELDAAANIKVEKSESQKVEKSRRLQIVRIGTSGSLQADIDCGSHVASAYAIGMDGLMNYYKEWEECRSAGVQGCERECEEMEEAFLQHMGLDERLARPYCVKGSELLLDKIADGMHHGITVTAPGFYGPQGRTIRLHPAIDNLNEKLASFEWKVESGKWKVTNLEMETSAIYGFSHLLGHQALTVCLIIANRPKGSFLNDYHPQMKELIGTVVERLAST